jgi:hypothetical protein
MFRKKKEIDKTPDGRRIMEVVIDEFDTVSDNGVRKRYVRMNFDRSDSPEHIHLNPDNVCVSGTLDNNGKIRTLTVSWIIEEFGSD